MLSEDAGSKSWTLQIQEASANRKVEFAVAVWGVSAMQWVEAQDDFFITFTHLGQCWKQLNKNAFPAYK